MFQRQGQDLEYIAGLIRLCHLWILCSQIKEIKNTENQKSEFAGKNSI